MSLLKRELAGQHEEIELYLNALSSIGIVLLDAALNILDCNRGFTKIFHLRKKPVGAPLADFLILGNNNLEQARNLKLPCSRQSGVSGIISCSSISAESGYLLFCERMLLTESSAIERMGGINNELINLQRESVKKNLLLEKLGRKLDLRIAELEDALARVKQLEGIIPICSYCKKIRDDQDSWQGLEKYISAHSEASFSHGICPECFAEEIAKMD